MCKALPTFQHFKVTEKWPLTLPSVCSILKTIGRVEQKGL